MNRKLLNGFLVLAVATSGAVTFTSCKDEDFRSTDIQISSLQAQIDALRGLTDQQFKDNLENLIEEWLALHGYSSNGGEWWLESADFWMQYFNENGDANPYGWTYEEFVAACSGMYTIFEEIKAENYDAVKDYVDGLYNMMFNNIFPSEGWFRQIFENETLVGNLINRASSVSVNQTFNPVFGSFNLPVGVNSKILAGYIYKSNEASYSFPVDAMAHMASASPFNDEGEDAVAMANILDKLAAESSVKLPSGVAFSAAQEFGNMGGAVLTINPFSVNFTDDSKYSVSLVNSQLQPVLEGGLSLDNYKGTLTWGATRAEEEGDENTIEPNNGVYALNANATLDNYTDIAFDFDKSALKDDLKQAYENKSLGNIAELGASIFRAVNNKLDAYAVKVAWNEKELTGEYNADGTPITKDVENYVLSDFDLAAVVAHPLSYGTMISKAFPEGKKLPMMSPLEELLDRIGNKFNITFEPIKDVDHLTVEITWKGEPGEIIADVYGEDGKIIGTVTLTYDAEGINSIDPDDPDLTEEQKKTLNYFIAMLMKNLGTETQEQVDAVIDAINKAIEGINKQLEDFQGLVGDFHQYLEDIKNSNKLSYANKFIDIYNKIAGYANRLLADPNHYLQVMMAYNAVNGPRHMYPGINVPTVVDSSKGDGFEVYITSHTADVVVPSYYKYLAITGVVNADKTIDTNVDLVALNKTAGLNTVVPGHQERMAINIKGLAGKTYRLSYISVDYRGVCSMENYYLMVK